MIPRDNDYLSVVFRCPVPKRMPRIIIIPNIPDVSGKHKNLCGNNQWMMLEEIAVFLEFQMEVGSVLYFHDKANIRLISSNTCSMKAASLCMLACNG